MNKVRTGAKVSNEEILGFAKLFNDEFTLDNISRPRLVNMCKYMGIKPYGTDAYLRYMLRSKLARIKNDDRMIQIEGVESLSEPELRQACRDRGTLGLRFINATTAASLVGSIFEPFCAFVLAYSLLKAGE